MFHIVYKTTHIDTGRFYIGIHSTKNLDDGYMGSGYYIKRAFKKYGKDSFKWEILHFCSTKQESYDLERSIVTEEFLKNNDTYNLAEGGRGHHGVTKRSKIILLYDKELNYIQSFQSATKAAEYLGCLNGQVTMACKYSQQNRSSYIKNHYVCYEGKEPVKKDNSFVVLRNKTILADHNRGKKRPSHSKFLKNWNETNPSGLIYFTPMHRTGVTCSMAKEYYSHDLIHTWCKFPDIIISKMSITKSKHKLDDKVSYDWVGKTRREVGFYSTPRQTLATDAIIP